MFSIDLLPPTHTTHTYTLYFGASFSLPWGWYNVGQVCVCSCRGRSQTIRRVCSVCASHFSISSFETRINNVFAVFSVLICIAFGLTPLPLRNLPYVVNTKFRDKLSTSVTNVPRRFMTSPKDSRSFVLSYVSPRIYTTCTQQSLSRI